MDVKITFLNGVVEEEIYIKRPEGFEMIGRHMCVDLGVPCMVSNKRPKHGTLGSTHISMY